MKILKELQLIQIQKEMSFTILQIKIITVLNPNLTSQLIVNGAGVTYVQDYKSHAVNLVSPYSDLQGKVETQFLDYHEGKPFLPGTDFVVDFPSKRAATHEKRVPWTKFMTHFAKLSHKDSISSHGGDRMLLD
ncbi:uncharacterized protein LOC113313163 [Papaver somniferum]|uniref:uncharacterized protein LOC113313163 n=1 Tax=Papaver somniferum TaxID=3469 RepID=UPI000E6F5EB4|nr:uncharacterized protein LOC113313163 [Papaver somniferum]